MPTGKLKNLPAHPDDQRVDDLLHKVGQRIRTVRESKRLPRRVLSDISGISPRYLAQLENGQGNISIGLLLRVAIALDLKLDWLVSDLDDGSGDDSGGFRNNEADQADVLMILRQYHHASEQTRESVAQLLRTTATLHRQRQQRVCLIGLRGAGKSTLGLLASETSGVPFLELNTEIEKFGGMSVTEIIAMYGPEGYRKFEAAAVDAVADRHEKIIIAAAGGIVTEQSAYETLLSRYNTVWIRTSPEEHLARVSAQGDTRPMEGYPEALTHLREILVDRKNHYERAQMQLDTSGDDTEHSLAKLMSLLKQNNLFH